MESDQQQCQSVQLSLSLDTAPPHTISIHDPSPAEPLKVILTLKQIASPFPDRPITILTKYCCLDNSKGADAFRLHNMGSPHIVPPDTQCPTPELFLHLGSRVTHCRVSGDPDLLKRPEEDGWYEFTFITIPPVGHGHAEVEFDLPPSRLVRRVGLKDFPRKFGRGPQHDDPSTIETKMIRFLRPGDTYSIRPWNLEPAWWAFGSLEGEGGLRTKKIARWTLPDDIPLVRGEGEDETDEVSHRLRDLVDLHEVNYLRTRSCVEDEDIPDIRKMRADGWVFGEPTSGLSIVLDNEHREATFTITA